MAMCFCGFMPSFLQALSSGKDGLGTPRCCRLRMRSTRPIPGRPTSKAASGRPAAVLLAAQLVVQRLIAYPPVSYRFAQMWRLVPRDQSLYVSVFFSDRNNASCLKKKIKSKNGYSETLD